MHGPNGFLRQFAGKVTTAGPEVSARHDGKGGAVRLVLTNDGHSTVTLTIKDEYGKHKPATYRLRPGAHVVHSARTERTHGWYDLTVTADHDGTLCAAWPPTWRAATRAPATRPSPPADPARPFRPRPGTTGPRPTSLHEPFPQGGDVPVRLCAAVTRRSIRSRAMRTRRSRSGASRTGRRH